MATQVGNWKGWKFKGDLQGLQSLLQALGEFSRTIRGKILRKAVTKGAQPLAKDAKRRLAPHKRTKQLWRSIGYVVRIYRQSGVVAAFIGPRHGHLKVVNGERVNPVKYAHLVEKGRKAVTPKRGRFLQWYSEGRRILARRVRATQGVKFIEGAWTAGRGAAQSTIADHIRQGIAEAARKAAAKATGKGK